MTQPDVYGEWGAPPPQDLWYDSLASGRRRQEPSPTSPERDSATSRCPSGRWAVPAGASFLLWYAAYASTAAFAPQLLVQPVAGPLNFAILAGVAQGVTTLLLVWTTRSPRGCG